MNSSFDNLIKDTEIIGLWFLPGSENKIPGVFKYSEGQSILKIFPSFEKGSGGSNITRKYPLVYGETQNGIITLTDVIFNFPYEVGSVHLGVFGHHLKDDRKITSLGFTLNLLHEWAFSKDGFNIPEGKFVGPLETYSCNVNDITCTLNISVGTGSHYTEGRSTYTITSFYLKSESGKNIADFIEIYIAILHLLQIIMGRNLKPLRMTTLIDKYSHDVFVPVKQTDNFGHELDHLFNFPYIRDRASEIFKNWFEFYFENKYLIEIFIESLETKIITISDFFAFASILEGYYKSQHSGESDYKSRIRKVLSIFSGKFSNLDAFIDKVEEFRHDNFHLNKRKELDRDTMSHITFDLYFLLRMAIMNGIGVNMDEEIIKERTRFKFLKKV